MSDLPDGWIARQSKSRANTIYYFNKKTGESQWEKPTAEEKKVRCSHILVKHKDSRRPSSWKEQNITRTKEEAISILNGYKTRLDAKEISFADLAKTESDCNSAKRGGDLDFFTPGTMQEPFEKVAFALQVGEMSGVVDTGSGVHLILRTA